MLILSFFGNTITLEPSYTIIDGLIYSFEWRKDSLDNQVLSTDSSIVLTNVADSGTYFLTVTASDNEGQTKSSSIQADSVYTIQKATIEVNIADIDVTYDGKSLNEKVLSFFNFITDMTDISKSIVFKDLNGSTPEGVQIDFVVNAGNYSVEMSFGDNYNPLDVVNFTVKQKAFTGNLIDPDTQLELQDAEIVYGEDASFNETIKKIIEHNRNNQDIAPEDRENFSVVIYKKNPTVVENTTLNLSMSAKAIDGYTIVDDIAGPGEYKIVVSIKNDNYTQAQPVEYNIVVLKKALTSNSDDESVDFTNKAIVLPDKVSGLVNEDSITDELIYSYYTLDGTKLDNAPVNAGKYKVEVSFNGNDLYEAFETFSYVIEVKAINVDLVWENLDKPVQKGEFVVKCYYVNVDGEKIYLDVIGGGVEPGEYSIRVENKDSNYIIAEADSVKSVTVIAEKGGLSLTNIIIIAATGGVALLFMILIPIIVRSVKKKKRRKEEVR